MSLIDLIPVILAGSAGLAAGGLVPTSGEKLMAYKVKKQMKKFVVYGFCGWTQWLYPVGVGASWMAAALEASVLKALFFMIKTLIISKKPGNTGKSRDKDTEFTTHLLHSEGALTRCPFP